MSATGLIVIASAVLIQGGMMGTYIRLSRAARPVKSKRLAAELGQVTSRAGDRQPPPGHRVPR